MASPTRFGAAAAARVAGVTSRVVGESIAARAMTRAEVAKSVWPTPLPRSQVALAHGSSRVVREEVATADDVGSMSRVTELGTKWASGDTNWDASAQVHEVARSIGSASVTNGDASLSS